MQFEIVPAHDLSTTEQLTVFNDAFAGYLAGWSEMDSATFGRFACLQGADLCHSRFVREKDGPLLGFGYMSHTGNTSRLCGMGLVPAGRKTGAATHLLLHLIDEARMRREKIMVLEVFEQNLPAYKLYQRNGFREVTRLFGWRRAAGLPVPETPPIQLEESSILAVSQIRNALDYPELPWQISRHAIVKLPLAQAFRDENACTVIGDPAAATIRLHGFFAESFDWSQLRTLTAAILSRYGDKEFFAPAIFPEQFGREIFEPLGFIREPLNQFLMRRELDDQPPS